MTVARDAASQAYGVIGLAPGTVSESICQFFKQDGDYGIQVESDEDGIELTLNLVVEYGLRIKTVTDQVTESVRYHVEKSFGVAVKRVNVHVRGLRISDPD